MGADHRTLCHDTMTNSRTPEYYSLSLLFWDHSRSSRGLMVHSGIAGVGVDMEVMRLVREAAAE